MRRIAPVVAACASLACVPGCRSVPNPRWCDRDPPDERSLLDQLRVEKILLVRIDALNIRASDARRTMVTALTNSLSIAAASLFYDYAATSARGSL